jgi:hypothetical protein
MLQLQRLYGDKEFTEEVKEAFPEKGIATVEEARVRRPLTWPRNAMRLRPTIFVDIPTIMGSWLCVSLPQQATTASSYPRRCLFGWPFTHTPVCPSIEPFMDWLTLPVCCHAYKVCNPLSRAAGGCTGGDVLTCRRSVCLSVCLLPGAVLGPGLEACQCATSSVCLSAPRCCSRTWAGST